MAGIVVGVDGSENSLDALRWAADEARRRDALLRVVAVFNAPIMSTGYEVVAPDPSDLAAASNTMLDAAVDTVRQDGGLEGVHVATEVVEGHAGERLIELSHDADLVVVGARGHGGFLGMVLGSVTGHVVNHAACPVVVVRNADD
ncbi:MAG: universal stress protein [Actinomycetes bacterium]